MSDIQYTEAEERQFNRWMDFVGTELSDDEEISGTVVAELIGRAAIRNERYRRALVEIAKSDNTNEGAIAAEALGYPIEND